MDHWYFPVERQQFDEDGKLVWSISGLVRNPVTPDAVDDDDLQSLSHTVYVYDEDGRTRHVIADVGVGAGGVLPDPSALNNQPGRARPPEALVTEWELQPLPQHWPQGWPRMETAAARNYVTTKLYNNPYGELSDIFYPNGRRWAERIVTITLDEAPGDPLRRSLVWNDDGFLGNPNFPGGYNGLTPLPRERHYTRIYTFNDLEFRGGETLSRIGGEVRDCDCFARRFRRVEPPPIRRRVFYATQSDHVNIETAQDLTDFLNYPSAAHQPRFLEEQRIEYAVDSTGRLAQSSLLETGPNGALVNIGTSIVYNLIDVIREVSFDGTKTRTVRNLLGQPVRRYVGTDDLQNGVPDYTTLALTERIEYGAGVNDAWKPTIVRRYTANPSWASDPFSEPASPDPDGYVTRTHYDWRMRPVRVDRYGETSLGNRDPDVAPRLSTTLTFLDQADRPILEATFGSGTLSLPEALDPVEREEWVHGHRPNAADLYTLTLKPTSVVETFYGPDGNVVERRTYHDTPGQVTWHEEHTYPGRGGQTVYQQRPGQPVTISILDGLARTVETKQLGKWSGGSGWTHELSRTDYDLDADGNVCATATFERVLPTGDRLSAEDAPVNAVRTRSVQWFDPQKRLTASAELGSERLAAGVDELIAGPTAYTRDPNDGGATEPSIDEDLVGVPNQDPIDREGVPAWARLSINRYSMLTGRLIWTANPDSSITQFEYDKAGRLSRRIENAYPPQGSGQVSRTVEYEYYLGRLTGIRAYRTEDGTGAGGTQTTRLFYGAKLMELVPSASADTPPTYTPSDVHHASLIGRMHLPVAPSGEPSIPGNTYPVPLPHEDPNINTGDIVLRYTFDGQVAERIDARGVVFRYFYDGLGRLAWVVVGSYSNGTHGTFSATMPAVMLSGAVPVDRVMAVQYLYNAQGRLSDVISKRTATSGYVTLTHTRYEYDERGNLIKEWQGLDGGLGATPPAGTAVVEYVWDYAPTNTAAGKVGHDRLEAMVYPAPPGGSESERRRVEFAYDSTDGIDDRISRLTAMSSGYAGVIPRVAQFEYAGVSRRAGMTLNPLANSGLGAIVADLRSSSGLPGLDSFGRLRDLHFRNAAAQPQTLLQCEHGYDISGNRLYDRVTQWPSPALQAGAAYETTARSLTHGYDEFDRLTESKLQKLIEGGVAQGPLLRRDQWYLDLLGNWQPVPVAAGNVPSAELPPVTGRVVRGNVDGYDPSGDVAPVGGTNLWGGYIPWQDPIGPVDSDDDDLQVAPVTDGRNEVASVSWRATDLDEAEGSEVWQGGVAPLHDPAGNLAFDGTYVYQYDAWGRLVQVNAGRVHPLFVGTPGYPYSGLQLGPVIKHYTYDGLGRLVRTQSPFPTPATANGNVRSERLFYDGIRRIQEVRIDPAKSLGGALASENITEQQLAQHSLAQTEPAALANAAQWQGDGPAAVETGAAPLELEGELLAAAGPTPAPQGYLAREYIWGPGDAWHPASVDELLAYYGENRQPWWVLQDSSGDIAAVCTPGAGGIAQVAAQQRYDAYGEVTSADHLLNHPFLSAGHKGLFYDRLDRGVSEVAAPGAAVPPGSTVAETPRLVPFARGVYYVRNRSVLPGGGSPTVVGGPGIVEGQGGPTTWAISQSGLSSGAPVHGRFMQADPNATAMVLVRSTVFHGHSNRAFVQPMEIRRRFRNGANLYEYLGGAPLYRSDALGLDFSLAGQAVVAGLSAVVDTYGVLEDARMAYGTHYSVNALLLDATFVQLMDVEWASDWSQPDDQLLNGMLVDEPDVQAGDSSFVMANLASGARSAGRLTRNAYRASLPHVARRAAAFRRGFSTARTYPRTIQEANALKESKQVAKAGGGEEAISGSEGMKDARWPASDGWEKWKVRTNHVRPGGSVIEIHFVRRTHNGAIKCEDFKIKD